MGDYQDPDVGTLRTRTLPNFWNHTSCDHAVSTRLLPAGPHKTLARVTWLVDEKAVEGKDYTLDSLLPIWHLTTEQDWTICERQQAGVSRPPTCPAPSRVRNTTSRTSSTGTSESWRRERALTGPHRRDRRRCGRLLHRLSPGQARQKRRAGAGEERADARLDLACRGPGRPAAQQAQPDAPDAVQRPALPDARGARPARRRNGSRSAACASPRREERWSELKRMATTARSFDFELQRSRPRRRRRNSR